VSSPWTHSICVKCWNERNPDRQPVVVREEFRDETAETCCFCGALHGSGIYMRFDPKVLLCKGVHASA